MSFNRGRAVANSDSFSTKQNRIVRRLNEDPNNPLSPTADRRSFYSLPDYGRLPLLLRIKSVELDRTESGADTKWGFSLRNIQVFYKLYK